MTELELARHSQEAERSASRKDAMREALREMRVEIQTMTSATGNKGIIMENKRGSERNKRGLSVKFRLTPQEFPRASDDIRATNSTTDAAGSSSEDWESSEGGMSNKVRTLEVQRAKIK
jgi:hypothetical protein